MKQLYWIVSATFLAGSVWATEQQDVLAAAKKLAEKGNYSWTATTESAGGGQFRIGPTEGKVDKNGTTHIRISRNDATSEIVLRGGKAVVKTDAGWQAASDLLAEGAPRTPGRFLARMAQNFRAPAAQAEDLAAKTTGWKLADGAYAGSLTPEAVAELLMSGRRGGGNTPAPRNVSGTVKFWVRDGVLTKFEYNVKGTVTFNDNDRDVDRTTTVEIRDVGSTKVDVPEEAQNSL